MQSSLLYKYASLINSTEATASTSMKRRAVLHESEVGESLLSSTP